MCCMCFVHKLISIRSCESIPIGCKSLPFTFGCIYKPILACKISYVLFVAWFFWIVHTSNCIYLSECNWIYDGYSSFLSFLLLSHLWNCFLPVRLLQVVHSDTLSLDILLLVFTIVHWFVRGRVAAVQWCLSCHQKDVSGRSLDIASQWHTDTIWGAFFN